MLMLSMTKRDDHLTFDFTGTAPQAGVINCTYAGSRGGVMLALLPTLAGNIPWAAGLPNQQCDTLWTRDCGA